MNPRPRAVLSLFLALWGALMLSVCLPGGAVHAAAPIPGGGSYEAALPADLSTTPDLCVRVPCKHVLPGATSFSQRMGQPPYVEGYAGDGPQKKRVGFVMLSTDITDTPAYSGKPVVTLIGMDEQGKYTGVKVLKHSEPILLLGIPESALTNFNNQYLGHHVGETIEIGRSRPEENIVGVDAISGATVTVIAQNQVITTSGGAVARQVGILEPTKRDPARYASFDRSWDWQTLVNEGIVQNIRVMPEQVGLDASKEPFIDLWFGPLNHPDIGKSLLGANGWRNLMSQLKEGDNALFVIRTGGHESFKGSGFVRGGIYDRVQVRQGADQFTFRDTDALNLYGLEAAGAPTYNESSIFIVRSKGFSAAYPWRLGFVGNRVDRATGHRTFVNFDKELWLPAWTLEGGRPKIEKPKATWVRIWEARALPIALFVVLLVVVGVAYAFRESLTRRSTHKNKWPVNSIKYTAWTLSIIFVGFGVMAVPSITQVLTWFHSLLFQWKWELFLSDPFIFLFWIFIILTVFLFGRGLFCGWLCPFGSLTEMIYKLAEKTPLKKYQFFLPMKVHDKLKWLKYVIFFVLLTVSLFSMGTAEKMAEIEPFKTTFLVGIFNRAWPYTLFVCAILAVSLFTERPYCKYICPLGASLAMPSTFRWFGLKRKQECNSCKACAAGCGSLAIDANGRIDHRECLHCLDCMILYTDTGACPPLVKERKRRERDGLPLTPIDKYGYFIPIKAVPGMPGAQSVSRADAAASEGVNG